MYLERLLKDTGIVHDIIDCEWWFVITGDGDIKSLSDILIKNIDKIVRNFDIRDISYIKRALFDAIQEDKLEEWAESLYNNK